MVNVGLFVRLEAKPHKASEVQVFLRNAQKLVEDEPKTQVWFAIRLGPTTFGIFDAFADESGRQAHLAGRVAASLKEQAGELLAEPPVIEKADILAAKVPEEYCLL